MPFFFAPARSLGYHVARETRGSGDYADDSKVKPESDYDVLYRIMTTRMSVRRIRPDPIPKSTWRRSSRRAAGRCPARTASPWEYLVIKDPKKKKISTTPFKTPIRSSASGWSRCGLSSCATRLPGQGDDLKDEWQKIRNSTGGQQRRPWHEAPVVIVVLGDGRRQWATVNAAFTFGRHASHFTDGLANTCTHMQLAIASLGLGSHWGTVHVQEPLKRVLGVPI